MAPSTRLRSNAGTRVNYAPDPIGRLGTRGNSIPLEETSEPGPATAARKTARKSVTRINQQSASPEPTLPAQKTARKTVVRVKAGAVAKARAEPKRAVKAAPKPKKKERPTTLECFICATTKNTARSFKAPDDACEHFHAICNHCIQKMLKTKVAGRQLAEAGLACPFPNCDHALDYAALKTTINKPTFDDYDNAVVKHALSAGESYVACLSPNCGLYFSAEECKDSKRGKQQVACPHCDYELCLTCNRPWKSHGKGGCNKAKKAEDKASEKTVKSIGAKPCPKCGVNIEKNGGCDHMTCQRCRHNFCWVCLVPYSNDVQHIDGCPHGRVHVAGEPGNWAPDNMNMAQINNLINQANRRLDDRAPGPPLHGPVFPPMMAIAAPPQHVAVLAGLDFAAMLNPFNWGGGGNGGPV
ncbi:hypothetical protein EJ02DRAFT_172583 [Clathrospora elynae]|uniref:RBR-type E3 ubiquitin transferase n=1 Tax=Clathrospora elynae TaxID=706981 RepID=A0A6A5T263_9PLEO|nr:hypothetical protein EJ02DRAFT_172583 [Clathrospora elynae]